jgi:hypothetical protein
MPLRAKIDETKLPKMATQQTNGEKPKTGIKVIIIGAGTHSINYFAKRRKIDNSLQASAASQQA